MTRTYTYRNRRKGAREYRKACKHCLTVFTSTKEHAKYCSKACSNAARGRSFKERLTSYFTPGEPDECWPWVGPRDRNEYGVITSDSPRRQLRANRAVYEQFVGPIPEGRHVMHTCDNPPCVNPNHLRCGTVAENNADKKEKGRHPHGVTHPLNRLSEDNVMEIRRLKGQETQQSLANRFGIHQTTVSDIQRGKIWKHL